MLGIAEASDGGFSPGSLFSGVPIDSTSVIVRYTVSGDANLDRTVDITDLGILASNWQQSPRRWSFGDFTFDQTVDIADLGVLASNWQGTAVAAPSAFTDVENGGCHLLIGRKPFLTPYSNLTP
jgi:hypothetical protein